MHHPIRRYPAHLIDTEQISERGKVVIRPLLPQDRELFGAFVGNLSQRSRNMRFMAGLGTLSTSVLNALTHVDYETHLALLAVVADGSSETIVAEARCALDEMRSGEWEFAVCVADDWQGRGLGERILTRTLRGAEMPETAVVFGDTLANNQRMIGLATKLGFSPDPHAGDIRLRLRLADLVARRAPGAARAP